MLAPYGDSRFCEKLPVLTDGGMTEFVVYPAGIIDELNQFGETGFSGCQRLLGTPVLLVTVVFGERRPCPAQTETPALESGGLVGESGEVAFRCHGAGGRDHMP